jgi:hypothetical protein
MVFCDLCKCLCNALSVLFFVTTIEGACAQFIAFVLNQSFEMSVYLIFARLIR